MPRKPTTDSPVPNYNGGNGPGDALSMPTKHYKSSDLAKGATGKTIDGPCPEKGVYTK